MFLNNGWKGKYLFITGENNCSYAVEFEADWACSVDLYQKVAQLPFQSTSVEK
jgi:hypothetical protein